MTNAFSSLKDLFGGEAVREAKERMTNLTHFSVATTILLSCPKMG